MGCPSRRSRNVASRRHPPPRPPPARCPRAAAHPSHRIRSAAAYAAARAAATSSPVAVTFRIRPPFVTRRRRAAPCPRGRRARPPPRPPRSLDRRAAVALRRVVAGREHDGHGCARRRLELDAAEIARRRGGERGEQVAAEQRQQRLRLRVAEAAVVLEHPRPVRGQHQPREERPDERMPAARELREDRPACTIDERARRVVAVEARNGRVRAHAAGVRARGRRRRRA